VNAAAVAALAVIASAGAGCTATVDRSYPEPMRYVQFAAREAAASTGFVVTRNEPDRVDGQRTLLLGVLAGQGNEELRIDLRPEGPRTAVAITSRKRFLGFLAARHHHERVARWLDRYVRENQPLRDELIGASK
jgi:hypothetical protein